MVHTGFIDPYITVGTFAQEWEQRTIWYIQSGCARLLLHTHLIVNETHMLYGIYGVGIPG